MPEQFAIEQYPTVWQMTSTVTGRTTAPVPEIFRALFPCASITGAPKVATMKIIAALERQPRGIYCGAIGHWSPHDEAVFNVAIRTITVDHGLQLARYGIGSGVTWDSAPEMEYRECLDKARILNFQYPAFSLLESLRYDGAFTLLDEHLDRLAASAAYFGFPWDRAGVIASLEQCVAELAPGAYKVRLLYGRNGQATAVSHPLTGMKVWRLGLAASPVTRKDVFLYHKTSHREVYDTARASRLDCDDVLLWNEREELTESTIANIALRINGTWYTPPVESGLLAGTKRAEMLASGELKEHRLVLSDLARTEAFLLINSVRGSWTPTWVEAAAEEVRARG